MALLYKVSVQYIPDELNRSPETDEPYVDYRIRTYVVKGLTPKLIKYQATGTCHFKKGRLKKIIEEGYPTRRVMYLLDPDEDEIKKQLCVLKAHVVGMIRSKITYLEKALNLTRTLDLEDFRDNIKEG